MTYIVSQKSGQTQASRYIEENNVSDYDLKLSGITIEAFISVTLTTLLRDNAQALI